MLLRFLVKDKHKRRRLAHIGASFVIFIHAYERYESGHGSYLFFALAGLVFLTVALLHPIIEKKAPWIDGLFLVIEAILSFVIAAEFFSMGKKALPVAYMGVGIFQLIMAFRKGRKGLMEKSVHQPQ